VRAGRRAGRRLQGRLDIVVNAAGILHSDDVAGIEDELWARTLEVNLTGVMRVCRTALPSCSGSRRARS